MDKGEADPFGSAGSIPLPGEGEGESHHWELKIGLASEQGEEKQSCKVCK